MSVRAQKRSSSKRPEDALEGLDNFGATLEKYIRAVQNHEYMVKFSLASKDPFIATSRRHNDHIFFDEALLNESADLDDLLPPHLSRTCAESKIQPSSALLDGETEDERGQREFLNRLLKVSIPAGPWETGDGKGSHKSASGLINTRTRSTKKVFWERVGAAVIGGAFLIAPMWILALQRSLFVHLSVATACVTAFGVSVSIYLETVDGVFAATLAYAAVIMVFVGIVIEETGSKGP
ncbi:hypothetical protein SMACR_08986 [Sordaria macrospora]|uniref:WGS project CABT00000000 data, contig 2.31 n=3 Tax=Sordaria macrospora TaxID=5147 RepID=F7W5S9_SORMK|nr:uncharacterized protein SMAC_08986 [Sordaria macrospora k-hell]KAA8635541.1 hypothetical protein SMACR_08986 [Sordaria macrospora]CCC12867.1 unnamed protein product [Sordaria macrospora k-hell]